MTEDQLQQQCIVWARNTYQKLRHFGIVHIPNGGTRHRVEATKLKAIGVAAGFPDLICIMPNGHMFFVEMKDEKGIQSEAQKKCEEFMIERNVGYFLIRDFESFKQLITKKINENI